MKKYSVWEKRPTISSAQLAEDIVQRHKIEKEIAQLLIDRGVYTPQDIEAFMHAQYSHLSDPFLFGDMDKATERIKRAVEEKETIYIYGDYDADGIMASCILYKALLSVTQNIYTLLPNRFEEGYGLNNVAIDKMHQQGASLIITVDNGATAFDEVAYANGKGLDVIITDHHECMEMLPEAYAVINPKNPLEDYPYRSLCGAGVAFKLAQALMQKEIVSAEIEELIVFAMIGTVADIVSLTEENRQIVALGLQAIQNTKNAALIQLMEDASIVPAQIKASDIGFKIAPRINASGRMTDANETVQMFCTHGHEQAKEKAKLLSEINAYRQEEERAIFESADEMVMQQGRQTKAIWVLSSPDWHEGVLGITAGRLAEKYQRPFILLAESEEGCKGSARSIAGFNILEAIKNSRRLLERFGGHSAAAGVSLLKDNVEAFQTALNAYALDKGIAALFYKTQLFDIEKEDGDFSEAFIQQTDLLSPFGYGNPKPVIRLNACRVENVTAVGAEKRHISCKVISKTRMARAIAFSQEASFSDIRKDDVCDILLFPQINTYRQVPSLEYEIKDIFFYQDKKFQHEVAAYRHFERFYPQDKYIPAREEWMNSTVEEAVARAKGGDIFIAHSYTLYKRLVRFLRYKESEEAFEICFNEIKCYQPGRKYILLCPLVLPSEGDVVVLEANCMEEYEKALYAGRNARFLEGMAYQDTLLLNRAFLAHLYVRLGDIEALCENQLEVFLNHINRKNKVAFNYFMLRLAIDVFASLGLLKYTYEPTADKMTIQKIPQTTKKDIYQSEIMIKLNLKK